MAPPTRGRQLKSPTKRVRKAAEGYFFPNEVVRMLRLQSLDYRQLRRLFALVAVCRGKIPARRWARFTFQDLASLRGAILALGGIQRISASKRLPLKRLERACEKLRTQYGLTNPLTQARLRWDGRDVIVQLRGARFEPDSGQLLLRLSDRVAAHLAYASTSTAERRVLKARIDAEAENVRSDASVRTRMFRRAPTSARLRFGESA